MTLTKEEIWERLRTDSVWVTDVRTPIFPAVVPARQFRLICMLWLPANMSGVLEVGFEKLEFNGITYTPKFCPIPLDPATYIGLKGVIQVPEGAYCVENPILTLEGGTNLYGKANPAGTSINVTVEYWDLDV